MGDVISDFYKTNLGVIVIILGIVFGLQRFIELILAHLVNKIMAAFGSAGIIIVIGIFIWLFQKRKK
ncbi:hypothetical protein JXA85_07200 [Candidatus Woesearchaeota archaeon]|nr:hypothetical protein [Candidatus Woesearchaeota archaeon]